MRQAWSRNRRAMKGYKKPRTRCPECGKCAKRNEGKLHIFYTCKTKDCALFGGAIAGGAFNEF